MFRSSMRSALRTISTKSTTISSRYLTQIRCNSSHATAPSLKPFIGKVITITGGARGIGLATARYLAARGATVCISDVLEKELGMAEEGIFRDFPDVNVRKAVVDVSKSAEVNKWIADVKFEFGELNGCVNNAGVWPSTSLMTKLLLVTSSRTGLSDMETDAVQEFPTWR